MVAVYELELNHISYCCENGLRGEEGGEGGVAHLDDVDDYFAHVFGLIWSTDQNSGLSKYQIREEVREMFKVGVRGRCFIPKFTEAASSSFSHVGVNMNIIGLVRGLLEFRT